MPSGYSPALILFRPSRRRHQHSTPPPRKLSELVFVSSSSPAGQGCPRRVAARVHSIGARRGRAILFDGARRRDADASAREIKKCARRRRRRGRRGALARGGSCGSGAPRQVARPRKAGPKTRLRRRPRGKFRGARRRGGRVAAPPRGATWIFRGGRSRTSRRHAQVAKLRQLSFNLKKNQELRQDVVSGDVGAARLMAMDADELATSAVREERKKMAESLRRVDISQTGRGDAAAASWIFRGDVPSPVPRGSS